MSADRAGFRADLEGLRGVAILLVVLFHAGVPGLAGGFVGVDVFFVLSGFFITGLLARDLDAPGGVDLAAFYGRRALRILPLLLVVVAATLAAVMWLYAPIDRPTIAASARAVALSAGNVHFARESVDYFSAGENPLLHTWSLGVEQQFYLVWPLVFVGAALCAQRRRVVLGAVVALTALSLVASAWVTLAAPRWAFYLMPTRVWEFGLGALLVLAVRDRALRPGMATLLQVLGALAVAVAVVSFRPSTPYPGLAALLPALGTVGIIVGGRDAPDRVVTRLWSAPLLRWLGRLSFGWYLWHWPLVGLGAVLHPGLGVWGKLGWSAAALVLAWSTYHTVERSSRDGRLARIALPRLTIYALAASVVAALAAHVAYRVAERQASTPAQRAFAAARDDRMIHDCWAATAKAPAGPCEFGDRSSSTVIALLGDSHAEHWLGGLDRVGRERGWKIVAMVKGGCPVADLGAVTLSRRPRHDRECARYRAAMVERIVAMRPAAAILSSWDHYVPIDGAPEAWQVAPDAWRRGLRATYARLTAARVPTVVLRGTPRTWLDVPSCLSRREARLPLAGDCTYDRARAVSRVAAAAQDEAVRGLPVALVDMNDRICATARCPVVRDGIVVFTDDNHLTATFTRSLAPVLGARLDSAFHRLGAAIR